MKYRENFKLAYNKKPSYQVDYDKKTVKCHLTCKIITPDAINSNKIMDSVVISANGYAKCDEHDTFSVEVGKKIALARAESLAYHKARVLINQCAEDAYAFVIAAEMFEDKSTFVEEHNENYIKRNFGPFEKKQPRNPKNGQFMPKNSDCDKKCYDNGITNDSYITQPRDENGRFAKKSCCNDNENKQCCNKESKNNKGISINITRTYSK
jgi:hypothetical protein